MSEVPTPISEAEVQNKWSLGDYLRIEAAVKGFTKPQSEQNGQTEHIAKSQIQRAIDDMFDFSKLIKNEAYAPDVSKNRENVIRKSIKLNMNRLLGQYGEKTEKDQRYLTLLSVNVLNGKQGHAWQNLAQVYPGLDALMKHATEYYHEKTRGSAQESDFSKQLLRLIVAETVLNTQIDQSSSPNKEKSDRINAAVTKIQERQALEYREFELNEPSDAEKTMWAEQVACNVGSIEELERLVNLSFVQKQIAPLMRGVRKIFRLGSAVSQPLHAQKAANIRAATEK